MLGGLPFETGDHQAGFFSRHLLIPKRDGELCLILDLRGLNLSLHPLQDAMGLGTLGIPWDTTVFHYYCYVHIYSYMIVGKLLKFYLFLFQTKHLFIPSWACMYLIYFVLCCIYLIYLSIYHSQGEHEAVGRSLHTVILGTNVPKKVSRAVLVRSNRATKFGKLWQTAVKSQEWRSNRRRTMWMLLK